MLKNGVSVWLYQLFFLTSNIPDIRLSHFYTLCLEISSPGPSRGWPCLVIRVLAKISPQGHLSSLLSTLPSYSSSPSCYVYLPALFTILIPLTLHSIPLTLTPFPSIAPYCLLLMKQLGGGGYGVRKSPINLNKLKLFSCANPQTAFQSSQSISSYVVYQALFQFQTTAQSLSFYSFLAHYQRPHWPPAIPNTLQGPPGSLCLISSHQNTKPRHSQDSCLDFLHTYIITSLPSTTLPCLFFPQHLFYLFTYSCITPLSIE